MLVSPSIKATLLAEIERPSCTNEKTREELEQELIELPDYSPSIFEHLKSVEPMYAPKANFMENQSDINSPMRSILIDWLIEVADEYKLHDETLFLCVQYIDRFLSTVNVTRSKLQLLGTTCMYIAAKYEEMCPPALDEFSFITDNTYEMKHILRMEQIVMKMLNFSLSGPTCYTFLQYYLTHLKTTDGDRRCLRLLSNYLCALSLLNDQPFSSCRPSMVAASCLLYAQRLLTDQVCADPIWSTRHVELTSYTQSDLNKCTLALVDIHAKTYHQDKITSSILRRYLHTKNDNEPFQQHLREIIHASKREDDEDDDVLDLTLDEFDEDNMSMDHQR